MIISEVFQKMGNTEDLIIHKTFRDILHRTRMNEGLLRLIVLIGIGQYNLEDVHTGFKKHLQHRAINTNGKKLGTFSNVLFLSNFLH